MRKFTVITKDGSKWLRPVNHHPKKLPSHVTPGAFYFNSEWQLFENNNPDVIYIGSRPEGTILDESEVTAITQARHKDYTGSDWFNVYDNGNWDYHETRTAYTDAESHDRHISDDYPGVDYQPLFNHMSKQHGLTLTTGEMDEIIGLSTYILAKK